MAGTWPLCKTEGEVRHLLTYLTPERLMPMLTEDASPFLASARAGCDHCTSPDHMNQWLSANLSRAGAYQVELELTRYREDTRSPTPKIRSALRRQAYQLGMASGIGANKVIEQALGLYAQQQNVTYRDKVAALAAHMGLSEEEVITLAVNQLRHSVGIEEP